MKKSDLVEKIEAYAVAKATGNAILIRGALGLLDESLGKLPDEIKEVKRKEKKPNTLTP